MGLKTTKVERVGEYEPEGLQHGGNVHIRCSNCNAILMDILISRPKEPQTWKVQASCPFCPPRPDGKPESSYPVDIKGGFHAGGYGKMIDEDQDIPSTSIDYNEYLDNEIIYFYMTKASEHAVPLYN